MTAAELRVQATEFTVSVLPEDDVNRHLYEITVAYRGRGLWAVTRRRECLGRDGKWDFEQVPSERTDEWLAKHRFPRPQALRLARKHARLIEYGGTTAEKLLTRAGGR